VADKLAGLGPARGVVPFVPPVPPKAPRITGVPAGRQYIQVTVSTLAQQLADILHLVLLGAVYCDTLGDITRCRAVLCCGMVCSGVCTQGTPSAVLTSTCRTRWKSSRTLQCTAVHSSEQETHSSSVHRQHHSARQQSITRLLAVSRLAHVPHPQHTLPSPMTADELTHLCHSSSTSTPHQS
jgi:hypothetical protein